MHKVLTVEEVHEEQLLCLICISHAYYHLTLGWAQETR